MLSRAHSELLIDILSWVPNVLAVAGVAFAFWLVAAEGLNLWTALVMVGTAAIPGIVGCLIILLEERVARLIREQTGRAPEPGARSAYAPTTRALLIGASISLLTLGFMCAAPAVVALLLCGTGSGAGRCWGNWTNAASWTLLAVGIASFVLMHFVFDPKKLDVDRSFRLRRNAERRKARRQQRAEVDAVADIYEGMKERKPEQER